MSPIIELARKLGVLTSDEKPKKTKKKGGKK